jgi:hypothetical protein
LEEFFVLLPEDFEIFRHAPEAFLVIFADPAVAQRVLHSQLPPEAPCQLVWKRWHRQATARFEPLGFRVLVELKGIPSHARNVNTVQAILGTACADPVEAPFSLIGNDRLAYYVVAWCYHPDLITVERMSFIPNPPQPFEPGNLFQRPHEIIHSKRDGVWYNILIRVVESQDWNESSNSSGGTSPDRFNSSDDEYFPRASRGTRRGPWPKRTLFDDGDGDGLSSGPSLGPGWGPPFASARGWSLGKPLTFRGCNYSIDKQQDKNTDSHCKRQHFCEVDQANDPAAFVFSNRDNWDRETARSDPMLVEADCTIVGKFMKPRLIVPRELLNHDPLPPAQHWVDPMVDESLVPHQAGVINSTPLRTVCLASAVVDNPQPAVGSAELCGDSGPADFVASQVEPIHFPEAAVDGIIPSPPHDGFINSFRGTREALPLPLPPEVYTPVKNAVANFAHNVCRAPSPGLLQQTAPRRRTRRQAAPPTPVIRRSERLARKSQGRASNPVLQAQNVLMKRMGVTSSSGPPNAAAFQCFLEAFSSLVTPSQCEALDELIPAGAPAFNAVVEELDP